jgi:hypothetical protein
VTICVALVIIWVAVDAPKAPELTRGEATFWWRTLSPIHTSFAGGAVCRNPRTLVWSFFPGDENGKRSGCPKTRLTVRRMEDRAPA